MTDIHPSPSVPVFVRRQTAARELDISTDTFDLWVRQGVLPQAAVHQGGIFLWRWAAIVEALAPVAEEAATSDPFIRGIANVAKGSRRAST